TMQHAVEEREVDQGGARRVDLIVTMHVLGTTVAAGADGEPTAVTPQLDLSNDRQPVHVLGGSR
ncbi:MAG: hypothetical protein ACRDLK_07315, partial [Gaiellaceae bacterium]